MKLFATSLDKNNEVCQYVQSHHYKYYTLSNMENCDFIGIYLKFAFNYKFDHATYNNILSSKKPIVIFDYFEYGGPSWHDRANEYKTVQRIYGYKFISRCGDMRGYPEYVILMDKLEAIQNRIRCYFLREMFQSEPECPFPIYPIDYCLSGWDSKEVDSLDKFANRPIQLLYNWGNTNNDRRVMQYTLYKYGVDKDWHVAETEPQLYKYLQEKNKPVMILWHRDHNERIDFRKYLPLTKLCIDVGGCGIKCFRNMQSAMYSASIKQLCGLQFAYPWLPNENCLELLVNDNNELLNESNTQIIDNSLHNNELLYNIYINGVKNAEQYIAKKYINNYINPRIYENIKHE